MLQHASAALAHSFVHQTGTLESLISLSEELPKTDASFTATVAKTVDTLRNLLNNDPTKLRQHVQVNDEPVDDYLLRDWRWNEGRYGVQRPLRDMVDVLNKVCLVQHMRTYACRLIVSQEMTSIDNVMKSKLNNYNLAKGSLVQMQRKKTYAPHRPLPSCLLTEGVGETSLSAPSQTSSRRSISLVTPSTCRPSLLLYPSASRPLHPRGVPNVEFAHGQP